MLKSVYISPTTTDSRIASKGIIQQQAHNIGEQWGGGGWHIVIGDMARDCNYTTHYVVFRAAWTKVMSV